MPGNDNDLETAYSASDINDVAAIDATYVSQSATGQYAIHQYKEFAPTTGDNECFVRWYGQTDLDPSTSPVVLQIYNRNTSSWETINEVPIPYDASYASYDGDSRYYESPGANTDFYMNASVPDLTNYRSAGNIVAFRIYQLAT